MKKRSYYLLAFVIILSTILSACGSSGDGKTSETGNGSSTPTEGNQTGGEAKTGDG